MSKYGPNEPLPPSPRSRDMYGSPEGSTYSPKMASPRIKVSPRTRRLKKWPRKDIRRMLHVVYRVGNIEESIKYYQKCLGMHILRKIDAPEDKYLTVFMGYGREDNHLAVELTYNYGVLKYEIGTDLGHFGIAVPDVQKTLNEMREKGFLAPATTSVDLNKDVYAYIKDPDGYPFKLIQRKGMRERLWQASYKVADIDRSILFYQDAYGMFLLSRNDYPSSQKTFAYLGYNLDDTKATVIELECNYGVKEYTKGTGYVQMGISTDDVYETAYAAELQHARTIRPPGPLPGIPTKIYSCLDPDGWKTVSSL
ncbi:lactoylglutathione lyase isoform X2 [Physcomitrium patens]|uniref:VOC domain-containing protein n=1 Tax=Physcomitrium patens TaxID=3218 RepID=A0A7I4F643_PHYPA|nr:lactoylglutathione lyase-like isoform X2 [Physcomitrium patens]|eukprot:XP_024398030.1 lactoylglutathione lyase-like isoform X2 [Physcomitrella patens]